MFRLPSCHDNYGILTAAAWAYGLPMPMPKPTNIYAEVVALMAWVVGARLILYGQIDALSRCINLISI
jgi:hypothetical protein